MNEMLVQVLVVVAVMAALAGAVTILPSCEHRPSKAQRAANRANVIRQAADLWQNVDAPAGACPSLSDLLATKKLDPHLTEDPWGSPYQIDCTGEEVRVVSPGRDRKIHTPDDVRDSMKPAELDAIESR